MEIFTAQFICHGILLGADVVEIKTRFRLRPQPPDIPSTTPAEIANDDLTESIIAPCLYAYCIAGGCTSLTVTSAF